MTQEVAALQNARAPVVDDGAFRRTLQSTTKCHQYLKFVDGRLTADGTPEPAGKEYLVPKMEQVGRMFHEDGGPPEICEPDQVDELNSRIPASDWPVGLNGEREPPFKVFEDIYLVDPHTGASFIFSNCTKGIKIAAERLASQVQNMRRIRGANVFPVITISSTLMKTRFGQKARPSFEIIRWVGDEGQPALKPVKAPTASEIIDDDIPF